MWGAQALLEVRRRFLVGSGQPSMLMLVRSAAALATAWKLNCGNGAAFSREMCLVSKYGPHRVLMHLWSRTLAALRVQEAAQPRWVGGRDDVVLSGQDTFSGWPQVPWFQSWGPSLLHTPSGASESAEAGASALTSTKAAAAGLQIPAMVLRPSPRLTEGPGCIFVTGSMGSTLVLTVDSIRFE